MKKIFIILSVVFMFVILTGLSVGVDAQETPDLIFGFNEEFDLKISCENNGSYCSSSSQCNVTVAYPNGALLLDNAALTSNVSYHNITVPSIINNETGPHTATSVCCDGPDCAVKTFTVQITKTGTILETSESVIFLILTIAIFVFFLISGWLAVAIPYKNEINEQGMVIKVTKLKYIKLFFVSLSYILFIVFLNSLIGISENFVSLSLFSGTIGFLFQVLNFLAWPLIVFILVVGFFEVIRDANFNKNMGDLMRAMN